MRLMPAKKLGFGLMRMPPADPSDPAADGEEAKRMAGTSAGIGARLATTVASALVQAASPPESRKTASSPSSLR